MHVSTATIAAVATISAIVTGTSLVLLYHTFSSRRRRLELEKSLLLDEDLDENDDDKINTIVSSLLLSEDEEMEKFQKELSSCIYLDYNGTTPVHPLVVSAMLPYLTVHFGNPSSSHYYGQTPREAVLAARKSILKLIISDNDELGQKNDDDDFAEDAIIFTGCGTESDNLAIQLALQSTLNSFVAAETDKKKQHVVTTNVEHPAVMEYLKALQARGEIDVTYVPVDEQGIISSTAVINAIRPNETVLVTIMLANNETGAIQPIPAISSACRARGVLFHTDAAQAVGKISLSHSSPSTLSSIVARPDMITIVGHKFGAPKGIAALYVRPGCLTEHGRSLPSTYGTSGISLVGGGQERGRRAGTENVPYIVGMGRAAELLTTNNQWKQNALHMKRMRRRLLDDLIQELGDDIVRPNGPIDPFQRLPNTLSVGLKNVQSGELLKAIGMKVAASAGSACHASDDTCKVSSILRAMNVAEEYAVGTLRLSVGPGTTVEEVDVAAKIIAGEAKRQLGLQ